MKIVHKFALLMTIACSMAMGAQAGQPGQWRATDQGERAAVGVVYPDYSDNEMVGIFWSCHPASKTVRIIVSDDAAMRPGKPVIRLVVDGQAVAMPAVHEESPFGDEDILISTLAYGSPMLGRLLQAKTIDFGHKSDLLKGVRGFVPARDRWRKMCRL